MKNLDSSFLKLSTLKRPVADGDLLVADPFLAEKWFNRAVISIIDHEVGEGTTGVVVNLPLETTLDSVIEGITREDPVSVYCGGPVSQDRLYFLHTLGEEVIPESRMYSPGLWLGGDFEAAIAYVNEGYPIDGFIRFFIGYSGWSAGQLDEEIKADTWALHSPLPDPHELLTGEGDAFWHTIVRRLGTHYRPWTLMPQNVQSN
ncbi:MAG: YqgE/AlgH family protein [Muribaculaceae bacterium]|nr:YqgE/AlgH family protein [Muribaculaceae bacterium]